MVASSDQIPFGGQFHDPAAHDPRWHPQALRNGELSRDDFLAQAHDPANAEPKGEVPIVEGPEVGILHPVGPLVWPCETPEGYYDLVTHQAQGRNDLKYDHPSFGSEGGKVAVFGARWWEWVDERSPYLYEKLDQQGRSVPATYDEILGFIGR